MCMCVSKQRKNITCGKKDQFLRWVKKTIHRFCLIELLMSIDLECATDQHFV